MPTGAVKWFNPTKGLRLHPASGRRQGCLCSYLGRGARSLNEGQAIEFELASDRGRTSAEKLRVR
jgi:CspA family cold shock protein